jgi:hypothetical protein
MDKGVPASTWAMILGFAGVGFMLIVESKPVQHFASPDHLPDQRVRERPPFGRSFCLIKASVNVEPRCRLSAYLDVRKA